MPAKIPAHIREQQINDLPNISFVRWEGEYRNNRSKAICRCDLDGHEWAASAGSLIKGHGCPKCGIAARVRKRRTTEEEQIAKINALPEISFVRWSDGFKNNKSKAVCRCAIDGFEWAASISNLTTRGSGCPECAKLSIARALRTPEYVWLLKINDIPNIEFVEWFGDGRVCDSKAKFRCKIDGHEWVTTMRSVADGRSGCPQCAPFGYDKTKPGTLYILRSECGTMVKIGISNNHEQRHAQLRRRTPFDWHCIELLHSNDGSLIAELEKELHSWTEQAEFREHFDGYTEWRKWDDRLPMWIEEYRARA